MWFRKTNFVAAGRRACRLQPPSIGRHGGLPLRLAAVAAAIFSISLSVRAQVQVGDRFPSLADAGLTGGALPPTEGRVVLVDFWASWCAPCKASFPAFARINADLAGRGLSIVAVSVDEKESAYAAFVKKMHPPFAALHDAAQKLVGTVKVPAMPTSYLLGRDGRVRFVHQGFHGSETEAELRKEIETLLAEKN
ncbi:MAG TPA: TlpA disulfide reductase family protein [Opitutus sp.]|nr:TlpA disulfide reductase family protein [Opitutus sp.]